MGNCGTSDCRRRRRRRRCRARAFSVDGRARPGTPGSQRNKSGLEGFRNLGNELEKIASPRRLSPLSSLFGKASFHGSQSTSISVHVKSLGERCNLGNDPLLRLTWGRCLLTENPRQCLLWSPLFGEASFRRSQSEFVSLHKKWFGERSHYTSSGWRTRLWSRWDSPVYIIDDVVLI